MASVTQPLHRRTIEIEVYQPDAEELGSDEADFEVVARLRDQRPWAEGTSAVAEVHDISLTVGVRRRDLTITAARADMRRFPHAECPQIEAAFEHLVGLRVGRGYTRAVQDRFGRALGCTHLEFLARALGPVVVQAIPSSAARSGRTLDAAATGFLADTCHVWASQGVGPQKLALGWRPGGEEYPAPAAVELRRRVGAP